MSERPVVLVTGASRGIGQHLARHFVERDAIVVGCSRSAEADLDSPDYTHYVTDVRSEVEVVELFRAIRRDHGRLDVAINNAALTPTRTLVALTPGAVAADVLTTNTLGPFLVCREAVKLMMRRKAGRIVNVGSMVTRLQLEGEAVYTASKAALNTMTVVLAREVAPHGITCNVVAPGMVDTESMAEVDSPALRAAVAPHAVAEIGPVADVAAAIDLLIDPGAAGITGQIVYLGGA